MSYRTITTMFLFYLVVSTLLGYTKCNNKQTPGETIFCRYEQPSSEVALTLFGTSPIGKNKRTRSLRRPVFSLSLEHFYQRISWYRAFLPHILITTSIERSTVDSVFSIIFINIFKYIRRFQCQVVSSLKQQRDQRSSTSYYLSDWQERR